MPTPTPQQRIEELVREFEVDLESSKKEVGEIPENTCPSIDKVIKDIESYVDDVEYLRKKASSYESAEELASDLPEFGWNSPVSDLDRKLRVDNEKLRELGIYWYEKCKEQNNNLRQAIKQAYMAGLEDVEREIPPSEETYHPTIRGRILYQISQLKEQINQ